MTFSIETSVSPSLRLITFTPCVARPIARRVDTGDRMTWPCNVMRTMSSASVTAFTPTTLPFRSVVLMLIVPPPFRPWTRYSEMSVRFP